MTLLPDPSDDDQLRWVYRRIADVATNQTELALAVKDLSEEVGQLRLQISRILTAVETNSAAISACLVRLGEPFPLHALHMEAAPREGPRLSN